MSGSVTVKEVIPFDLLVEENEAGILYLENDKIVFYNSSIQKIN